MNRERRPLATLALVALISLIGAGCGSNAPSETGTASSSGSSPAASPAREKGLRFAQCMRDNGVGAFPDPDASGDLTIDAIANGSALDPSAPAFEKAMSACRDLQPAGFTGRRRSTQQQDYALEFADCIRHNGVQDFPDPAAGEPLVDTNKIPSSNRPGGMTVLNAAMHTCGAAFAGKLGLKGR
jgi:hypothetical protein